MEISKLEGFKMKYFFREIKNKFYGDQPHILSYCYLCVHILLSSLCVKDFFFFQKITASIMTSSWSLVILSPSRWPWFSFYLLLSQNNSLKRSKITKFSHCLILEERHHSSMTNNAIHKNMTMVKCEKYV